MYLQLIKIETTLKVTLSRFICQNILCKHDFIYEILSTFIKLLQKQANIPNSICATHSKTNKRIQENQKFAKFSLH